MKFIKLTCDNCNAHLEVDIDNLQAYCPYCGQKLLFDLDQIDRILAEKEQTKRSKEKTKRSEEATKRIEIEYNYKDKKDRREKAENRNDMIFIVFLICLFIGLVIFSSYMASYWDKSEKQEKQEHQSNNEVQVSASIKDLKKETVENLVKIFKSYGFENVEAKNMRDLIIGLFSKEGEIESITINGDSSFSKGDWFPADAIVIITYHGFPDD